VLGCAGEDAAAGFFLILLFIPPVTGCAKGYEQLTQKGKDLRLK
jgi:hypothetical protein